MKRIALAAAALALAGCGSSAGARAPAGDPGETMRRVIRLELSGRQDLTWPLLVREQRRVVDKRLYLRCSVGPALPNAEVAVLGVRDETFTVAVLGTVRTKAVRWRLKLSPDETILKTGHLVAQDGSWHWTLSEASVRALRAGRCP